MGTSSSYMVAVAILFLTATVAYSATPPYKCFPFSGSGHATERSHDKSGTRQLRKRGADVCPGPACTAIEPTGDIVREVGQPYEAYCLFDPTHINVSEVGFFREGNDKIQIPHTIVNDSAIKAEVTHDTAMKYSLWCSVNSQHLCSREVKIGYPPQDVTSLSCLSKNWVNLNCSWTTPYNPVDVQYHLTYVIVGFKEQSECPTSQSNDNSCLWVNDNFNVRIRDNWIMHFNATNKFNEKGVVYKHNVSLFKSVLPNPVENLEAHVDGPNNVTLTWTLPHPMDVFESIRCEASYRKHDEGDVSENATWTVVSQWKVKPDQWNAKEVFNKTINNLNAYIQYDFRVRIHTGFGEVRPHMWSDAAISTQRTAAMRPTVAPRTTLGTFEIEENLKFRDIYVFWQRIDKLRQNGPNFRYEVDVYQISNGSQNYEKVPNGEIEPKESYFKFMNMKKNVAYRFEIVPVNSEGRPEADDVKAVVTVPEKTSVLKLPSFFRVTVYGGDANTNYALKWRIDSQSQEVETVTLYWCKKDKYEERCKNKLEWMVVTDPSKEKEDLVLDGESLYLFGISVNSRTSSSGIKWITCISKDGNQPPPLDQFKISSHSSREVNLEWSMDCKAKSAEPTGFVISYCDVPEGQQTDCPPDADMHYEHIMDEAVVSHKMQNLHPYANYIFNIAIQTDIGRSKWSKSVSVRTNPEKPSGPPQALEVKDYGQTWTLLSWKPPLAMERNGLVEKYKVSLEDTPSRLPDMMVHNTTPESTTYNVSGLDPFTKYTFKVIACTKIYDDYACGENSATVEHQTKIGAPSKIDDLYQNDGSLMWEHDCSNGPACFYEVKYYVNDTEYTNYTELNAASIDMRDLGITCSENENNLEMKLRAITRNESNNFLYGPWKEETVACPLPGSYRHKFPSISDNSQIVFVQLPQNNQYNTVINVLKLPERDDNVHPSTALAKESYNGLRDLGLIGMIVGNLEQKRKDTRGSVVEGGARGSQVVRHNIPKHSSFIESTDAQSGLVRKYERELISKNDDVIIPLVRSSIFRRLGISTDDSYLVNMRVDKKLPELNNAQLNKVVVNTNSERNSEGSGNDEHHHSSNNVYIQSNTGFLGNMKSTVLNIQESDSNTSEDINHHNEGHHTSKRVRGLNHKSTCPLFDLMKLKGTEIRVNASNTRFEFNIKATGSPYSILKSIYHHSVQTREPFINERTQFYELDDPSTAYISSNDEPSRKRMQEGDSSIIQQFLPIPEIPSSVPTRRDRRKALSAFSLPSYREQRAPSFHVQMHPMERVVTDSQILPAKGNATPVNLSKFGDETINTSQADSMADTTQKLLQETTVVPQVIKEENNTREVTGGLMQSLYVKGHPPVTLVQTPANNHFSSVELLQGFSEQTNSNTTKSLTKDSVAISGDMQRSEDMEFLTVEENTRFENPVEHPQPVASMIYRIVGSFNGNIGRTPSQGAHEQNRGNLKMKSSDQVASSNSMYKYSLSPLFSKYQGLSIADDSYVDNSIRNHYTPSEHRSLDSYCPFADLIKSKGVKVRLSTPEEGKLEFNVQGNGNFYDLLESLYGFPTSSANDLNRGTENEIIYANNLSSTSDTMMNDRTIESEGLLSNTELNNGKSILTEEHLNVDVERSAESVGRWLTSPTAYMNEESVMERMHSLSDAVLPQKELPKEMFEKDFSDTVSDVVIPRMDTTTIGSSTISQVIESHLEILNTTSAPTEARESTVSLQSQTLQSGNLFTENDTEHSVSLEDRPTKTYFLVK